MIQRSGSGKNRVIDFANLAFLGSKILIFPSCLKKYLVNLIFVKVLGILH